MALKSFKDFEAEKSPLRIVLPVVGAIIIVVVLGFLIFGSNEKQPVVAEVVEEPTPTPPPSPEELRQIQINQLRNDMEWAAAAQDHEKLNSTAIALLEFEPNDGNAWSHLGRVQEKRGEPAEALASYTKAIEFSEAKAFNLYLRARLLRAQGDLPAAVKDLEAAAQADPSSVGVANSLMIFKIQNGNQDEVRKLVQAYEKTGINRNAQFWLLGAAAIAMQDGNTVRATRCLEALKLTLAKPLYMEMLADPFFEPYWQQPEYRPFFSGGATARP
jgi:tetratricopeptide (TPR) repeat protein